MFVVLGTLLVVATCGGLAQAQGGAEYQVKAAYLYNFGKFVEWPADAFEGSSAPFRICILGDSPFDRNMERALTGRKIQAHPVQVIYPDSITQSRKCHVLFISASESGHAKAIVAGVSVNAVLTVGDTSGFVRDGAMINFIVKDEAVRFEINSQAAARARLKISSKLLVLGTTAR